MNDTPRVKVKLTNEALETYSEFGGLFQYATDGSAAVDLRLLNDVGIAPGKHIKQGLGISLGMQDTGMAAVVLPRSGLGSKNGLVLRNTVGLIDSDYRGEIIITLVNTGSSTIFLNKGDRVVQMLFTPIIKPQFMVVSTLDKTERHEGGFGSTGLK